MEIPAPGERRQNCRAAVRAPRLRRRVRHARTLDLTHVSTGGNLFDSGWFAYLFGAPLSRLFGLSGIEIFAYHQGLFFGLFFISLWLIASTLQSGRGDWAVAAFSAVTIGALSDGLLRAAAYPHYEIALLAVSSLAVAGWVSRHYLIFALCLVWLPLVREDGGLYGVFVCLACIALEYSRSRGRDARIVRLGVLPLLELTASAEAFLVKARYFPSPWFTFSFQFSGHSWDHVSIAFIEERLHSLVTHPDTLPVLAGTAILAAVDVRYASGFILLSPLYALHLLSVRPALGHFTLYYVLPWLLPPQ